MASFKIPTLGDRPSRQKLYRSMSLSEISPRKEFKVAQEMISGPLGNTIFRQYSYHELGVVPGTTSLIYSQKFVSEVHVNLAGSTSHSDISSEKNLEERKTDLKCLISSEKTSGTEDNKEVEYNLKRSHDPSDSGGDFKRLKLFRVSSTSPSAEEMNSKTELKRNFANDEDDKGHPRTVTQLLFVVVPLVLAVLATLGTQYAAYQKICEAMLDINASEHLLSSSIFGQEKAVENIVKAFKTFSLSEQSGLQVLVFSGATGVGKTYTASLLEESFPWKQNIHHFIMPVDFEKLSEDLFQKYPYCGDHLVIMDDLRVEDVKDVAYIVSYLKKLAEKNKVIAVLIFKFHKQLSREISQNEIDQMSNEVQTNLLQRDVNCVMIDFKTLEKSDVIQCIKESLTRHWIPISEHAINMILDQVDFHSEGCKRISSKIAVVNELWVRQE